MAQFRRPLSAFWRWLLRLGAWLVPLSVAWWWLDAADWFLRILSLLADATLPHWIFSDVQNIFWQGNLKWRLPTGIKISGSTENLILFLAPSQLQRVVLGMPLMLALLLATSGPKKLRLVFGVVCFFGLSLFGVAAHIWALLAVVVNHKASVIDQAMVPPAFMVIATPFPDWVFHLSSFVYYLAVLVLPLIGPVLIWVLLCPRGILRLLVSLRR